MSILRKQNKRLEKQALFELRPIYLLGDIFWLGLEWHLDQAEIRICLEKGVSIPQADISGVVNTYHCPEFNPCSTKRLFLNIIFLTYKMKVYEKMKGPSLHQSVDCGIVISMYVQCVGRYSISILKHIFSPQAHRAWVVWRGTTLVCKLFLPFYRRILLPFAAVAA